MDPVVIELAEWTQRLPAPTRGSLKARAVGSLIFGGCAILLTAGGLVATLIQDGITLRLFGVFFVGVISVLLIRNGVHFLRHLPAGSSETRVQFAATYAFTISSDAIHFPGRFAAEPEDWPLSQTEVTAKARQSGGTLSLKCPGRRSRRFLARSLIMPPADICRLVEELRSAATGSIA